MTEAIFDPVACVTCERDATRNFIDVLRREQHALQQVDLSLLLPVATEKARQAQQLAQMGDARNHWLSSLGHTGDRSGMKHALDRYPAAASVWQELLQFAETANQLNRINGILLGQRVRYNQQGIAALQAATQPAQSARLYGSNGQPQTFLGGRRLGEG